MSPEAQRIAIAEVCGWKVGGTRSTDGTPLGNKPNKMNTAGCRVPDYLNDLNAIHEAEKTLTLQQEIAWIHQLRLAAPFPYRATAAQRAEAFLRTIGKWQDKA